MEFKSVTIKNFRNFEEIQIDLSNKNVFFGLNDVGKTNFLYALRFVFDQEVRKNSFIDSDFHCKNTTTPIEIVVTLDIEGNQCLDNQKLRAKLKGAISSEHTQVYIKLIAHYDKNEMTALPELYWGGDLEKLYDMKQRGNRYDIDYIMNVIYIDSYIDLNKLFKKNVKTLIKNENTEDEEVLKNIDEIINCLNNKISSLSGIKNFEEKITPKYKNFRNDDVKISVKSEIAIKGLYSNIVPYIKNEGETDEDLLYPTSGEGRKKLLTYSIFDLIAKENEERKINLFLIEEPENHLHKSIQITLSNIIFNDNKYKYVFLTTHSSYILQEMDEVNLVRIFNETKIDSVSNIYVVPTEYKKSKKKLNKDISEAIFSDRILLVEGNSELILFEKVLSVIDPLYESKGICILPVNGINFKNYFPIFDKLKIPYIIKTDNDLRKDKSSDNFFPLGLSRLNNYIQDALYNLPTDKISANSIADKRRIYTENKDTLDKIRKDFNIFLSQSDLENDLDEILHANLVSYLGTEDVVSYLQKSKQYNMIDLVSKISDKDCTKIYDHYNFACLKEVLK